MKKLRKFLREQFAYVESLATDCDPDQSINLEVARIVEESRRRCCEFGFDEIGEVATVLSPRSALPIFGKLLQWAREQKSKTDGSPRRKSPRCLASSPTRFCIGFTRASCPP